MCYCSRPLDDARSGIVAQHCTADVRLVRIRKRVDLQETTKHET